MSLLDQRDLHAATTASTSMPVDDVEPAFIFDRYRFFPRRRRLFAGDEPVELGSRALELLAALIEADGRLVTTDALRKRVWPTTVVEDHNVQVQVSMLRRAFGEDRDLIRNEAGRGYRLATTVKAIHGPAVVKTNIPAPLSALIGREREIGELEDRVAAHRLVTLTGSGGIGKTRLGLAVARAVFPVFADGVWLVELGALTDPELIPGVIARALGIELGSNRSAADQLVAILQRKHLLLVLDNCEHLIDAVARAAERLLCGAPRLHILTTSQDLLAAEGERVYRVSPLKVPVADSSGAVQAATYSAVQLFVERAQAADPQFVMNDGAAAAVIRICRRLDGIPLAIELAAACVATVGLEVLAQRLDDRFRLLTGGRRTALKRHQTLSATLDWSYGLLEPAEQAVLHRIAIFAGSFTLDGTAAVAAGGDIEPGEAADLMARLVRKSLATVDVRGRVPRYRLLDTTRAYAFAKLVESSESEAVARRHAEFYRGLMEQAEASGQAMPAAELVATYAPDIDNIRAAINWAWEPTGDAEIGVALAAASAPLWILMSMLSECRDLVRQALARVAGDVPGHRMRHEMRLQVARAMSLRWTDAPVRGIAGAAERAFELADELRDTEYQLRALAILCIYRLRLGEYRASFEVSQRFLEIAGSQSDLLGKMTGIRLEGLCLFYLGDFARARANMERVLADTSSGMRRSFAVRFGIDQRVASLVYVARSQWLQGFVEQANRTARTAIEEARLLDHANSLCKALCDAACNISAMSGNIQATAEFAEMLIDCAEKHGLGMRLTDGLAFRAWAALRRGDAMLGLDLFRRIVDTSRLTRIELRHTIFVETQAEAFFVNGRTSDGVEAIERVIDDCSRNGGRWCLPELLRLRGEFKLRADADAESAAERDFLEALALAGDQGARSWQLRAATSLARLRCKQRRYSVACEMLRPIYDGFKEGFETTDLKAARAVLDYAALS